jgi:hypothetical protein
VQGETFNVTIGWSAWEAYSATWNLGTNSAFALGPRKTLIELAGRRTFRLKLTSSQQSGIKSASLYTVGKASWTGDQPDARPLSTYTLDSANTE